MYEKIFAAVIFILWAFSVFVYAGEGEYIDAEGAGSGFSISDSQGEASGCYIRADSSGSCVYITDESGNRLVDAAFKYVEKSFNGSYLRVRYYDTEDFSGFAVLNEELNEVIPQNNYYYLHIELVLGDTRFVGDRRDENGTLDSDYYDMKNGECGLWNNENLIKLISSRGTVSPYAEERVWKALDEGLVPENLMCRYFNQNATRYNMACLAVQTVLEKNNTNIYSYIADNNILLDYDKYVDVVSPDVLLAEEIGLIRPSEGKYFNPGEEVTRQEAAYTLNRLCELLGVETTPKETAFDDDRDIAEWAREAVYNVSGTGAEDSFILPQQGHMFLPNDTGYRLERAVTAVWRIANFDSLVTDGDYYQKKSLGYGLTAYQNNDGKWGVFGPDFKLDPVYELPCSSMDNYFALDGYFTLALNNNPQLEEEREKYSYNTYYVFNSSGELVKTLTYTIEDVKKEKPCGLEFCSVYVTLVSGSNIVFAGETPEQKAVGGTIVLTEFIKRLVSEKISGEGYCGISRYDDGGFIAWEEATKKKCILNADGSFREYCTEEQQNE
ncbi:MAG: hypothetical protein LUD81_10150 [Clostridiales bacterium]|nr:hypothetical protein [Clostridiales bacterium]